MLPTKSTKPGAVDSSLGTDVKSYQERQKKEKEEAKKQALQGLEDVASSKEKEQLQTVLEGIVDMIIEQEAEENDIFGKYLFGQQRKTYPAKSEQNTSEEQDFLNSLDKWVVDHKPEEFQSWFPEVWSLVQQGKYANLLKPDDRPVYRLVSGYNVAKAYGLTKNETFKQKVSALETGVDLDVVLDGKPFPVDINRAFSKDGKLQSWGVEPLTLEAFIKPGRVAILMKTRPISSNGKFLLNPYELVSELSPGYGDYKVMISYLENEGEIVSYGDVRVEAAVAVFVPAKFGVAFLRGVIRDMYDLLENNE